MNVAGAFKSFRKRVLGVYSNAPAVTANVVGAVHYIDQLLKVITEPGSSISERVTAAGLLRSSIENNVLSSVQEVWLSCRVLLELENPAEVRQAGWRLTVSCIDQDDINNGTFCAYYYTIVDFSNVEDFHLILAALEALTLGGRRFPGGILGAYRLPVVYTSWIQLLAVRTEELESNQNAKDICAQWGLSTGENLQNLLELCTRTLKFNMSSFDESNIGLLVDCIVAIAGRTNSAELIKLSCGIIETIMSFGVIPIASLPSVIEILCEVAAISTAFHELAEKLLDNLVQSHLGHSTVSALCKILATPNLEQMQQTDSKAPTPLTPFNPRSTASVSSGRRPAGPAINGGVSTQSAESIGPSRQAQVSAVRLLLKLLEKSTTRRSASARSRRSDSIKSGPGIAAGGAGSSGAIGSTNEDEEFGLMDDPLLLDEVFKAWAQVLSQGDIFVIEEVSKCLVDALQNPDIMVMLPFGAWLSPTVSPFNLVCSIADIARSLKAELEQQPDSANELIVSILKIISTNTTKLTKLFVGYIDEKVYSVPFVETVQVAAELADFLDEDTTLRVIKDFCSLQYCSPFMAKWEEKIIYLLEQFFVPKYSYPSAQAKLMTLCQDSYIISVDSQLSEETVTKLVTTVFKVASSASEELLRGLLKLYRSTALAGTADVFALQTGLLLKVFEQKENSKVKDAFSAQRARIATEFARLFPKLFTRQPERAKQLYDALILVSEKSLHEPKTFRACWSVLSRLRANSDQYIYLWDPVLENDYGAIIQLQTPLPCSEGEFDLPSLFLKKAGGAVATVLSSAASVKSVAEESKDLLIDPSKLLSLINVILSSGADENVYALVLLNLPDQLSNLQLFVSCTTEIMILRHTFFDHLNSSKLPVVLSNSLRDVSKSDLCAIEIHALTILLGYTDSFSRVDQDKVVQTLCTTLNHWDKTANWALHCLVVCAYEIPNSIQRLLPQLLSKLQTKLSVKESSSHILEFILTLCLVDSLTINFNLQEFKRVFGMCFLYIRHALDSLAKSKAETDVSNSILSQYLLRLAFSSIHFLFLAMDVSTRPQIVPYLIRSLILADTRDPEIDNMCLTSYDFICRYAYANQPLSISSKAIEFSKSHRDDDNDMKRWIVGFSVLEITTNRKTGFGTAIFRRPTGTVVQHFEPALLGKTDRRERSVRVGEVVQNFSSNFWLMQMKGLQLKETEAIPIPNDMQSKRAIASLDRAPVVDFQKVGIIYIAPGQKQESDILANTVGSAAYRRFLLRIGRLVKLKNNREIYTGGLDTEMDSDGPLTCGWRGKISQIIFHVTSMMPNNELDKEFSGKKRHIGNNYVNIYFDESGYDFVFDVVKSQFNFINIVITPTNLAGFYRVRAHRMEGLANVLAAYEQKVISETELPHFVRHLSLKAAQYASVYNQHGEYTDNWLYRLDLINKLKTRLLTLKSQDGEQDSTNGEPQADDGPELAMLEKLDFTPSLRLGEDGF